ncbi:MAG: hypothetical protein ACLFRP_02465 [Puniceicoccaceae bacterium]
MTDSSPFDPAADSAAAAAWLAARGVPADSLARLRQIREWRLLSGPEAADWVREVDDSPYGWPEWVDAVLVLADLLVRDGRRPAPFTAVVGYVGCAAAGERATPVLAPLPELVAEAYREFGFAGPGEDPRA